MTGSGAGWPDEDTRACLDHIAAYLRALGVDDADDHALALLVEIQARGWRRTAARPTEGWQRPTRPAGPDTARAAAAQIRTELGWLPDTPDHTGDDTP